MACFDLAYSVVRAESHVWLRPKDGNELRAMMHYSSDHPVNGVVAIRYPRDTVSSPMTKPVQSIEWGTWEWLTEPGEIVVLAVGTMVAEALKAAETLKAKGMHVAVINARFVKPLDEITLGRVLREARLVLTAEEGTIRGGFGQAIAEYLLSRHYEGKFGVIGLPDRFITHGTRKELLKEIALEADSIASAIEQLRSLPEKPADGIVKSFVLRRNGETKTEIENSRVSMTGTDKE